MIRLILDSFTGFEQGLWEISAEFISKVLRK